MGGRNELTSLPIKVKSVVHQIKGAFILSRTALEDELTKASYASGMRNESALFATVKEKQRTTKSRTEITEGLLRLSVISVAYAVRFRRVSSLFPATR